MPEPTTQSSPDQPRRVGHETTDVSPYYVGLFALALTLMIALVLPLLTWLFWRFEAAAKRSDAPQSPLQVDQTPPPPNLQADPAAELVQFRREEAERLSSYGWIDPQQKIVHVPIERAIDILSERGLPVPAKPPASPASEERAP